ncbi:hypothetical protein M9458_008196 [Cirrhinus mrigala]|uniref:Uncharacterized protein n=1 Tax=Cirrhinus mrigala TaxID=683832 RepID=A0ABD0R7X8_CIRMR
MLRRIKVIFTTDQQELWRDSFGPYLQQESMDIYIRGPSETPADCMDRSHCYHQAEVIAEPSPADCETSSFHRQSD